MKTRLNILVLLSFLTSTYAAASCFNEASEGAISAIKTTQTTYAFMDRVDFLSGSIDPKEYNGTPQLHYLVYGTGKELNGSKTEITKKEYEISVNLSESCEVLGTSFIVKSEMTYPKINPSKK